MPEAASHFSEVYRQRLTSDYGPQLVADLNWPRVAQVAGDAGHSVRYVRVGSATAVPGRRPVLFINGFLAGITANAAFVADLASRGFDVLLQDQMRGEPFRNESGKRDATYTQALGTAAILESEGLTQTPIDVVTHSYGSLILDSLTGVAKQKDWKCFNNSRACLVAPSGLKVDESPVSFLKRYARFFKPNQSKPKFSDSYWQFEDEMFDAGKANLKKNPRLALREGWEIIRRRADLPVMLKRGIGSIVLVFNAEDELFSYEDLESSMPVLLSERVAAVSPYSLVKDGDKLRGSKGADHSDHQFNPSRQAGTIEQLLTA
ncbi:MAG TPA: hypothetical protein VH234_02550 [Candidatus Saccharimonadales bacterium]|jgi:hypothetical protein|nr:hypothetical protein [Candidatus Saccharimonadales bacterium]